MPVRLTLNTPTGSGRPGLDAGATLPVAALGISRIGRVGTAEYTEDREESGERDCSFASGLERGEEMELSVRAGDLVAFDREIQALPSERWGRATKDPILTLF